LKKLRKLFRHIAEDAHLFELLSKSAAVLVVRVAAAGMAFLLSVYLARKLGTDEYGYFYLALTVVMICGILARAGLDNIVVRNIAAADEHNNIALVRGNFRSAVVVVVFFSLLLSVTLYLLTPYLADNFFHKPAASAPLRVMLWFLVPFSVMFIIADALRGMRAYTHSIVAQNMITPTMALLVVLLLSQWLLLDLEDIILIYVLSSFVTLLYAWAAWHKRVGSGDYERQSPLLLLKKGLPLLMANVGSMVLVWSDTIILGVYRSAEEVGVYTAGSRTAMLITLILMAVNFISGPKYSVFDTQENHKALKKLSQQSTVLMLIVTVIPATVFIAWPEYVLLLFGEQFQAGASVLVVLTIGYAVSVVCGSVGTLLVMTGYEKVVRNITLSIAVLNIILSVGLVSTHGIEGVAWATAISLILHNLWLMIMVRKRLGFWTIPFPARYGRD
jgi:O-antigen/teichoic acid export membrane protein